MNLKKTTKKIYGNCKVLSPDGLLMFRCEYKKANWYLTRNLAEIIEEDPLTIKLNFKPNGLGNHNKDFGLNDMKNICVVCGDNDNLTKHHVVPSLYRKHFPLEIKGHNFHDVLSVCVDCHEEYEREADKLKDKYAKKYNIPTNGLFEYDKDLIKVVKESKVILNNDGRIPEKRIKEIKKHIKDFFDIKRLSNKRLISISKIDTKGDMIKSHGEVVISDVDINQFIQIWRKHFVDTMEPKYLPKNWKIDYEG